jgi:hypothetical protein
MAIIEVTGISAAYTDAGGGAVGFNAFSGSCERKQRSQYDTNDTKRGVSRYARFFGYDNRRQMEAWRWRVAGNSGRLATKFFRFRRHNKGLSSYVHTH